jgi:hypothetical protein
MLSGTILGGDCQRGEMSCLRGGSVFYDAPVRFRRFSGHYIISYVVTGPSDYSFQYIPRHFLISSLLTSPIRNLDEKGKEFLFQSF